MIPTDELEGYPKRTSLRRIALPLAGVLAIGALAYGILKPANSVDRAGDEAPSFELELLSGEGTLSDTDLRGKPVVLNFWASWCKPCTEELPLLEKTQQSMEAKGATVLGINTRDATEDALGFVNKFDLTFPSLRDGSGDFAERWGLTGYPESFLLDEDGRVAAARRGPIDQAWVDENVTPLLRRGA